MSQPTKADLVRELAKVKAAVLDALVRLNALDAERERLSQEDFAKGRDYDGHYPMAYGGASQLLRNVALAAGVAKDRRNYNEREVSR